MIISEFASTCFPLYSRANAATLRCFFDYAAYVIALRIRGKKATLSGVKGTGIRTILPPDIVVLNKLEALELPLSEEEEEEDELVPVELSGLPFPKKFWIKPFTIVAARSACKCLR